jgi:hypothetical protein
VTWKPAIRGNSEYCYLQIGLGFVRVLGLADRHGHLSLVLKVACSSPVIESCVYKQAAARNQLPVSCQN